MGIAAVAAAVVRVLVVQKTLSENDQGQISRVLHATGGGDMTGLSSSLRTFASLLRI